MSEYFFPILTMVEALAPYRLRTTWSTGETLDVDVEDVLHRHAFLAPVLNPEAFGRVHIEANGRCIEWFDTELGADNVYAWAKEQAGDPSHEMFDTWMQRNSLSLAGAADALGISRRMVSYYRTAHKLIPRTIWLACLGWETTRPNDHGLPRNLPTAREYAAMHA